MELNEVEIKVKVRVRNPLQKLSVQTAIEKICAETEPELIIRLAEHIPALMKIKGGNKIEALSAISKVIGI